MITLLFAGILLDANEVDAIVSPPKEADASHLTMPLPISNNNSTATNVTILDIVDSGCSGMIELLTAGSASIMSE